SEYFHFVILSGSEESRCKERDPSVAMRPQDDKVKNAPQDDVKENDFWMTGKKRQRDDVNECFR
ncbi:MAG: hypothetical protein N3F66_12530, partial [Spirochaetes bacterium]|nr:hypothetical protein [Spirochaetota bacterium]